MKTALLVVVTLVWLANAADASLSSIHGIPVRPYLVVSTVAGGSLLLSDCH
jgi:hypothetical protein